MPPVREKELSNRDREEGMGGGVPVGPVLDKEEEGYSGSAIGKRGVDGKGMCVGRRVVEGVVGFVKLG